MNRREFLQAAMCATLAGTTGCYNRRPRRPVYFAAPPEPAPANVVIISLDTLRADRLGAYGYPRGLTPHLDKFAAEAVLFEQCIAPAPYTAPSHASLFTGVIPSDHGCFLRRGQKTVQMSEKINRAVRTAAEMMQQAGYRTASVNGGLQVSPVFGFDRGFADYDCDTERRFDEASRLALEKLTKDRFFFFLHSYEIHAPYRPPADDLARLGSYEGPLDPTRIDGEDLVNIHYQKIKLSGADQQHVINCYDAEVISADRGVGRFLDGLAARDLYDDSLIVVTSDHGEELGEHGKWALHSHTLYDELLHVPLLVKFPKGRFGGTRVPEQVRLIDVLPTIVAAIGLDAPDYATGVDLVTHFGDSRRDDLAAVSQLDTEHVLLSCLRTGEYKLYRASGTGKTKLAYLGPRGESRFFGTPAEQARLSGELTAMLDRELARNDFGASEKVVLDDHMQQKLKELGYVR
ncbi:MAG: sulfatase [Candidatus Lernaella stagnicola]|nr:sulfatase [Candidatus Lernaella stagnicola]